MATRLVVVTGGGKGIGRAVVQRFATAGDDVVAVGRDAAALEQTVALASARGHVSAELCDVTDEESVGLLFERVGQVDVLVNNAGFADSAPSHRISLEMWRRHLDVNATAVFLCTRAVLPMMQARDTGRIVVVASTAAIAGDSYIGAYAASKHAAVGFMRSVAAELVGTGVTANAVCPTYVRTEMTARSIARIVERTGRSPSEAEAALVAKTPLGRLLEPEEVAAAVDFLCGAEAGAINGQALIVDGGGVRG